MKRTTGIARALWKGLASHKIASIVIVVAVVGGGYEVYTTAKTADAAPQYQIQRIRTGSIIQTVTGTGQVSAADQVDVYPQVSGAITSINATVGEHVSAGDLLATIDDTNAAANLASAKLSLAQLTEPAKPGDIANAENSLTQSYASAFNSVASTFTDLQAVIPGLNSMLYGQSGFLSDQRSTILSSTGQTYRNTAGQSFDKANTEYNTVLAEYNSLNRNSATSSIQTLLDDTTSLAKDVAAAVQDSQNAITWITTAQPSYDAKDASTAEASLTSWANSINGDVSSLGGASNTIASDQVSLYNLVTGADPLTVQAAQNSVDSAQRTYDQYFIRSPISGVVGRIPANVYDQAGGSTVIATVVGDQKIADISLDEVDAAKVNVGDPVSITLNAISNFTATGTVSEKDLVGTVTSGVVSYSVRIGIDTADSRILPGMSVNVTIVTNEIDNVVIVPSTVVKTQGRQSYVQVFSASQISSLLPTTGSSTRQRFASSTGQYASSTGGFASSTYAGAGQYSGGAGSFTGGIGASGSPIASRTVTITTALVPTNTVVTTGQSDNANTQITSGLNVGDWVVVKTVAAGSTQTTATTASTPSLLNAIGGARGGGGGAVRIGG